MTAIVRRANKYISRYTYAGEYRFYRTMDIDKTAEYDVDFATLVAKLVSGKTNPVVEHTGAKASELMLSERPESLMTGDAISAAVFSTARLAALADGSR